MCLKNIIAPVVMLAVLTSCKKDIEQSKLAFDVTVINNALQPATTFKVGDTVNFKFNGNPDKITFYSGEIGYRYQYRDRVTDDGTNTILNFTSALNTAGSSGTMKLLVSTDYTGYIQNNAVDSIAVAKATWTDISSRAAWATTATATASGPISLADYAAQKKPVYLAFRYDADTGVTQAKWTIGGIGLRHYTTDTAYLIDSTNFSLPIAFPSWTVSPGWGSINASNPLIKFIFFTGANATSSVASVIGTTSFVVTGAASATSAVTTQNWIVSGPLDLLRVLPDAGVAIKDMSENAMFINKGFYASLNANYTYRFTRPGTYNVVFYATTDTKDGQSSSAKTITLTVN